MIRHPPSRADNLRSAIAQEAARLMAEHGIRDFLVAKRKAAEHFGVTEGAMLPKNVEIEAALMAYQRLFGGPRHASRLQEQRRVALEAMHLFKAFEPKLVGQVLSGSATGYVDIQLHLFADSAEAVSMHLIDRRYDYEVCERRVRMSPERQILVPSIRFEMDDETVEAFVFPRNGIRQAPVSPVDGKPMRRAGMAEVERLASAQGSALCHEGGVT